MGTGSSCELRYAIVYRRRGFVSISNATSRESASPSPSLLMIADTDGFLARLVPRRTTLVSTSRWKKICVRLALLDRERSRFGREAARQRRGGRPTPARWDSCEELRVYCLEV